MAISYNVPSAPTATHRIAIEGITYLLAFRWSTRSACWYMDVSTNDGTFLAKNAKLVPNVKLLRSNLSLFPTGNFYVVADIAVKDSIPGRYNIGPNKDFKLVYFTNEELANVA